MSTTSKILNIFKANFLSKLIAGFYTIVLIRVLDVESYALFTNFQAIYAILGNSIFIAYNNYLVINISGLNKNKNFTQFITIGQLLLYFLISIPFIFFSKDLSILFWKTPKFSDSILLGVIASLGLILSNLSLAYYQATEDYLKFNKINILRAAYILLLIILSYTFLSIKVISYIFLFAQILPSFYFYYSLFKKYSFNKLKIHIFSQISLIIQIKFLIIYFFFNSLQDQIGVFIISISGNNDELANYGVALRYYNLGGLLIIGTITTILLPKFSKIIEDTNEIKKIMLRWIKNTVWLIFPLLIILYFCKYLYIYINGIRYEYSYLPFCVMMIGVYFSVIGNPFTNLLIAKKDYKYLFLSLFFVSSLILIVALCLNDFTALTISILTTIIYNFFFHVLILFRIYFILK